MNPILLATNDPSMWTVTVAGISIVFSVLLLLVGIFYLFGAVMKKSNGQSKDKNEAKVAKLAKKEEKAKQAAPKLTAAVAPVIEQGISGEVVAAISAAIAHLEGGNVTIRSIKKQATNGRPAWATAGIMDATRPF